MNYLKLFKAVKDRKYLINDILEKSEENEENEDADTKSTDGESDDENKDDSE